MKGIEKAVVLLLFLGLLFGVLTVLKPFSVGLMFGSIIAITAWPVRKGLTGRGVSPGVAAVLLFLGALALVVVPGPAPRSEPRRTGRPTARRGPCVAGPVARAAGMVGKRSARRQGRVCQVDRDLAPWRQSLRGACSLHRARARRPPLGGKGCRRQPSAAHPIARHRRDVLDPGGAAFGDDHQRPPPVRRRATAGHGRARCQRRARGVLWRGRHRLRAGRAYGGRHLACRSSRRHTAPASSPCCSR